jgi:hypothetical protein
VESDPPHAARPRTTSRDAQHLDMRQAPVRMGVNYQETGDRKQVTGKGRKRFAFNRCSVLPAVRRSARNGAMEL